MEGARPAGSGIGGRSALLEVGGIPVFVKRVPLTDLERRPENVMSTANVFGLPAVCQYGIGGPGSGVWRELAVHTMTTNWVLADRTHAFPLTYHWRVLPESSPYVPEELADTERVVGYWDGSRAVRGRLDELGRSSASVVLFLEYLPWNLREWFRARLAEGGEAARAACAMVDEGLTAGTSFMNSRGLLHLDAHFENILTDGHRLYFADFGLSLSSRFDLSAEESGFLRRHRSYDRCYTAAHLLHWLVTALPGHGMPERDALLRGCVDGTHPAALPEPAASVVMRYALATVVFNDFFRALQNDSRKTPYPAGEIERALGMAP